MIANVYHYAVDTVTCTLLSKISQDHKHNSLTNLYVDTIKNHDSNTKAYY